MKKLVFLIVAVVLLAALIVGAVPASAEGPPPNMSIFCKENNDFGLSHGECVSAEQLNPLNWCKWLDEQGLLDDPLGQCLSPIRPQRHDWPE